MFAKSDIEKYFGAEKSEAIVFIAAGVLAVLVSLIIMIWYRNAFNKGLVLPLVAVAIMHLAVGISVYGRADKQRTNNVYAYDMDPASLRDEELPRMQKVISNFVVLRWVEIVLASVGLLLIVLYRNSLEHMFFFGVGVGLMIQALLSLILDFFAEKRAHEYVDGLKEFLRL
jgi:type IV secretory pathway TrbD component